jgi:hypothetical protein
VQAHAGDGVRTAAHLLDAVHQSLTWMSK